MSWILWALLIILGITAGYFIIFFLIKFYDNMRYGNGLLSSVKQAVADCCGVVKSALRA